ncbi:hypothetical protein FIBSPDRAFT_832112, partial [Athelia psychrophila]
MDTGNTASIHSESIQQMAELEGGPIEGVEIALLPQDSNVASLVSSIEQTDTGNMAAIHAEAIQQMVQLDGGPPEEVEIDLLPHGSNVASLVSSVEQLEPTDTGNTASADVIMELGEQSGYVLFVGGVEWTRGPEEQDDNHELYVEVKVGDSKEVHHTMSTETAHWDEDVEIAGCLSSIVRIEIKSVPHNSSESLSVARAEISLQNLLEKCADGDQAVLGLAVAPLVSGMVDPAAGMDGYMGSKHSAPDSIGLMTVKLCRLSHEPPNVLQPRDTCSVSVPQMGQPERRIPEDVAEDLEISNVQQALARTSDWSLDTVVLLLRLGGGYYARFRRLRDLTDLENSIASLEQALAHTPDGHQRKAPCFSILGAGYNARFERFGERADVENSIASFQQAVALTPDGHFEQPGRLSTLGDSYCARFVRLGDLADVENSIASLEQALALTPDGHSDKPGRLSILGACYGARFEKLGDLADIDISV